MATLDTKAYTRQLAESFLNKPIGRVMTNPLTLSLMITVIVILIVIYTFDEDSVFRTFFRIFSICTVFLFINNHIIMNDMKSSRLSDDTKNILNSIYKGGAGDNGTMVVPIEGGSSDPGGEDEIIPF